MHLSMNTGRKFLRISIENVISKAISGIITFSSSCPACDAYATAVSAPMMWKSTWFMHSSSDGLTLPGMIEEPGCTDGSCDLRETGQRPRGEQAEVVGDARELEREIAQRRGDGDDRQLRLHRLAQIVGGMEAASRSTR